MPMTNQEAEAFFIDTLGPESILHSPESGRPYWKVASKGEANLYANFDLGPACGHRKEDGKLLHIAAVGVHVRFIQKGGLPSVFSQNPVLKVRLIGTEVHRLEKHVFPICPLLNSNVVLSWATQDISHKLFVWLTEVITSVQATPALATARSVAIEQALSALPPCKYADLFSIEAMDNKDGEESEKVGGLSANSSLVFGMLTSGKSGLVN